jgi:hypothetical protein
VGARRIQRCKGIQRLLAAYGAENAVARRQCSLRQRLTEAAADAGD